jgi:chlorite dismutase
MNEAARYVQALALRLDPLWRRLPAEERRRDAAVFSEAVGTWPGLRTRCYSTVGLQPRVDLLIWRLGSSLAALEEAAAAGLRTGLGRWLRITHSFMGMLRPSPYVRRPQAALPALFDDHGGRYLVIYPFTKTSQWYALEQPVRQRIMTEHMSIGHSHRQVRQLLASSFGMDDQDFLVAYETDDLADFSQLVGELRGTEGRAYTASDAPILTGICRSPAEVTRILGAM